MDEAWVDRLCTFLGVWGDPLGAEVHECPSLFGKWRGVCTSLYPLVIPCPGHVQCLTQVSGMGMHYCVFLHGQWQEKTVHVQGIGIFFQIFPSTVAGGMGPSWWRGQEGGRGLDVWLRIHHAWRPAPLPCLTAGARRCLSPSEQQFKNLHWILGVQA